MPDRTVARHPRHRLRRILAPAVFAGAVFVALPGGDAGAACTVGSYRTQTDSSQRHDDVSCIQTTLNALGIDSGPVDGWFGPVTAGAVTAFQTQQGITVDGVVGPETAGALGVWSPQARQERRQEAAPAPARQQRQQQAAPAQNTSSGGGTVWDRLAQCESGGNWGISTGNGYYGGLQFLQSTWEANGGSGNPANASREEQIRVAETLRSKAGFAPWPACSAKLGLR